MAENFRGEQKFSHNFCNFYFKMFESKIKLFDTLGRQKSLKLQCNPPDSFLLEGSCGMGPHPAHYGVYLIRSVLELLLKALKNGSTIS